MKLIIILSLALVLTACQDAPPMLGEDRVQIDPDFETIEIVDIAILKPDISTPDGEVLAAHVRAAAREALIGTKSYAVPDDAFVDAAVAQTGVDEPSRAAELAGADAALTVIFNEWQTEDLIPKSRIYAGGVVALHAKERVLWERSFSRKAVISPGTITPSNRVEMVELMAKSLTKDLLSQLPHKPRR